MYSHPTSAQFAARYHQDELLREAQHAHLVHEAQGDKHSTTQHRVIAAAVAVLMTLTVVVLI